MHAHKIADAGQIFLQTNITMIADSAKFMIYEYYNWAAAWVLFCVFFILFFFSQIFWRFQLHL